MWVESTEDIGSSFYFTISYLPVVPEDMQIFDVGNEDSKTQRLKNYSPESKSGIASLSQESMDQFTGKLVLLVEPNIMKFKYYEKMILATGAIVIKAENQQQWHDIMMQFDQINMVIIGDILFDNDDFNVLRNIKKEREKLPVVLIVSEMKEKYTQMLRNNLVKTTIKVPIEFADILEIMTEHIE